MKLTVLAVLLGLGVSLPALYGLLKPREFAAGVRKFPRSVPIGYLLMALGAGWFIYYVQTESASDFEPYKNTLSVMFGAIGLGACVFLKDFLAVRGLAVVMLLLAKLMRDTACWVETEWRLVIIVWAYVLVVAGMWFTVSPWRLRDLINWATANERRLKVGCAIRLAFGLFVIVLGLTAYRQAEARALDQLETWPMSGRPLQWIEEAQKLVTTSDLRGAACGHVRGTSKIGCAQEEFV
ncbi:MAG: hypothetical protein N2379_04415 [Verrucomicrobiae bacterium]|nr:hypothetical protein [Verrucomicrobiae bacterium]